MRAVGAALLAVLLPFAAVAADEVPVVVVPVRAAETSPEAGIVWATRGAVEAHPALTSVDVAAVLASGEGEVDDLEAGRAALADAQAAFGRLDLDRASEQVEKAVRLLLRRRDEGAKTAGEALLLLARVRLAVRDEEGAVEALRRALRLDPDLRLDPAASTPSLTRALEAARQPEAPGSGRLRVDADAPAAVEVDGRFVGVTPCLVESVPAGAHRLVVQADGRRRDVRLVEVRPGEGQAIRATLDPAPRAELLARITRGLPAQMDDESVGAALRDLKGLSFADQAILVDVGDDGTRAALFDLRAGRRVRTVEVEAGNPQDVAATLVRRLYADLDPRAPALADVPVPAALEPEPVGGSTGLTDHWWFWPAAGVAAAAAVAIPLLLLTRDQQGLPHHAGAGAVLVTF